MPCSYFHVLVMLVTIGGCSCFTPMGWNLVSVGGHRRLHVVISTFQGVFCDKASPQRSSRSTGILLTMKPEHTPLNGESETISEDLANLNARIDDVKSQIALLSSELSDLFEKAPSEKQVWNNKNRQEQILLNLKTLNEELSQLQKLKFNEESYLQKRKFEEEEQKKAAEVERLKHHVVWSDVNQPLFGLAEGSLQLVNRELALADLALVLKMKYYRAYTKSGRRWCIPLLDSAFGLGKTFFCKQFISKFIHQTRNTADPFELLLRSCHTVFLTFNSGQLLCDQQDAVTLALLRSNIRSMLSTVPTLFDASTTSTEFLDTFTADAGPVFIVLDEVGCAFSGDLDVTKRRDIFFNFYEKVLFGWLSLPKVFFVLSGFGDIFGHIGLRPEHSTQNFNGSPCDVVRINIHLLRAEAIETIITSTPVSFSDPTTLDQYFGLNTPEKIKQAGRQLFLETGGHPRTINNILFSCFMKGRILQISSVDLLTVEDKKNLQKFSMSYPTHALNFVRDTLDGKEVDLMEMIRMADSKRLERFRLANILMVGWEGSLESAKLFMTPAVMDILSTAAFTFTDYIALISRMLGPLAKDIAPQTAQEVLDALALSKIWEKFLAKRMLTVFATMPPLHHFLGTPLLSDLSGLALDPMLNTFPKMVSSKTDEWGSILEAMWSRVGKLQGVAGAGWIAADFSHSPDAVFACRLKPVAGVGRRVVIGLAAKNYGESTRFGFSELQDEVFKFVPMMTSEQPFVGSEGRGRSAAGLETSWVLLVGATHYADELQRQFVGGNGFAMVGDASIFEKPPPKPGKVTRAVNSELAAGLSQAREFFKAGRMEVVLLDLSTSQQRAEFFGLERQSELVRVVDVVVDKEL